MYYRGYSIGGLLRAYWWYNHSIFCMKYCNHLLQVNAAACKDVRQHVLDKHPPGKHRCWYPQHPLHAELAGMFQMPCPSSLMFRYAADGITYHSQNRYPHIKPGHPSIFTSDTTTSPSANALPLMPAFCHQNTWNWFLLHQVVLAKSRCPAKSNVVINYPLIYIVSIVVNRMVQ